MDGGDLARLERKGLTMRLTPEQKQFCAAEGYILIKGLLSRDEAAACRAEVHAIDQRQGETNATWDSVKGDTSIAHSHDVHFKSALFTRLLVDERITGIAQDLIGPNVQLHHNKMFIKPPERGSPFPMHQDYPYFPHRDHSMIAAIIHFDDAPADRGCVCVYPGTHKLGPLPAEGSDHHVAGDAYPIDGATLIEAEAGDAIFFHYLLVHGSGINRSSEPRTTLLIQMRDPADEPLSDRHASRGQGMMLAGIDTTVQGFSFAWERGEA
jgi:phytanoyl-CoA hydroxylase